MERRQFLKFGAQAAAAVAAAPLNAFGSEGRTKGPSVAATDHDAVREVHRVRITPISLEISDRQVLRTVGYDGRSPGPVLRMRSGVPTALEVFNESAYPETVHPHGQHVPMDADGTPEEGSPLVGPGESRRFVFVPGPPGTRWYHSHAHTHGDATRGLYTGQEGVLIVEGGKDPGAYDREVILITHDWEHLIHAMKGKDAPGPMFSVNGRALGFGDPVQVRAGERILFRIVNGNAHEEIYLALPGHRFQVVALDGNPVPRPHAVQTLRLGSGERVDAFVEMRNPGVWILGEPRAERRNDGLGVVVEYAGRTGKPMWEEPLRRDWDYAAFGAQETSATPDERIEMVFDRGPKSENRPWRINGKPFWEQEYYKLQLGRRYRLIFRDKSDRLHPLHLHRHSFQLVNVEGKATSGITKDTVCIEPNGHVEVDFIADQPGLSLFHCHMQEHMDKGFMSLFETS